jgi:hypothetical protein
VFCCKLPEVFLDYSLQCLVQPAPLATNVRAVFLCLLDQVSLYTTEGLERAKDALNDAAQQRNLYSIGSTVSRRVAAAAATAAEAAAAAGERSVRGFMVAVQRATSNVALVQQVIFYQTPILYPSFMMATP